MEKTLEKIKEYEGILDGDIINEKNRKIACLRCPDGEMIGLIETNEENSEEEGKL